MRPPGRLQPSEEGLADLAAPAAHELLVGLTIIEAVCRHRLLRAKTGRSYERPLVDLGQGRSLGFQAGLVHQVCVGCDFSLDVSGEIRG